MTDRVNETLRGSLYAMDFTPAAALEERLRSLDERVRLLRKAGTLTPKTLSHYYGKTRIEQVAESNAIEGSTLTVGETELAVLKGTTLTGHDPAFVRDARALNAALERLTELAQDNTPTDIAQLHTLHELIYGDRPGAGTFRREAVRILGSEHRPPKTWEQVMKGMEAWQTWSQAHPAAPAPLRAAVSHAWVAHVHPYSDGNGRTARALSNLELVRAGFPPIIIKRTERQRYLDALAHSDSGGDLAPLLDLVLDRLDGALLGLERSASRLQGFDPVAVKLVEAQQRRLDVWSRAVDLYRATFVQAVGELVAPAGGHVEVRSYSDGLELMDYQELAQGRSIPRSWSFEVRLRVPGSPEVRRLAWVGYRTPELLDAIGDRRAYGPALFWSSPNPDGYPPWVADDARCPNLRSLTIRPGAGDGWIGIEAEGSVWTGTLHAAAELTAKGVVELATKGKG